MAQIEPMDVDNIDSDSDNKENSFHHNVLPRTPCTEKGYEELDVSELNMKLRYSITPASSPMSKSCTANCLNNRSFDSEDYINNVVVNENGNLTRSFNSTFTKNETAKSLKLLPLQVLSTEQTVGNRTMSEFRSHDSTFNNDNDVTITVSGPNDIEDNVSLPSPSSSVTQTPEATTPTKEIPKNDGGSPILRGIKSVLNMFRSSQSPIPADTNSVMKTDVLPDNSMVKNAEIHQTQQVIASTPIANKKREGQGSKRSSPLKESVVFNDDLERELQWKDETTILFKEEKIPIHKLMLPQNLSSVLKIAENAQFSITKEIENLNSSVEYMDISNNDSLLHNKVPVDNQPIGMSNIQEVLAVESDGEFVDCETTLNNDVNVTKEINTENTEHEKVIEGNYGLQNCFLEQSSEQMIGNSKLVISNNNLKENVAPTDEYKPNMLSLESEEQKQTSHECHEKYSCESTLANCNLEGNISETSTSDVIDQSMDALVTLKDLVNVTQTLKKDGILDDFNEKMVSININHNIVNNITQCNEISVTPRDIAISEHIDFNHGKTCRDHDATRLPVDTPLPIDDDDKEITNVIDSETIDVLKSSRETCVENFFEEESKEINEIKPEFIEPEKVDQKQEGLEKQESQEINKISIEGINENSEHSISDSNGNQKLENVSYKIDVSNNNCKMSKNDENTFVGDHPLEQINDEYSNTVVQKDQVTMGKTDENKVLENFNDYEIMESGLNDCEHDSLTKSQKIGELPNITENLDIVSSTVKINNEYETTLNKHDLETMQLLQDSNPNHQKSIDNTDNSDNATNDLNNHQPVKSFSKMVSNIELNQNTNTVYMFDQEPEETPTIPLKHVITDDTNLKDVASNQSINADQNSLPSKICHIEEQTSNSVLDKVSVFDSSNDVNGRTNAITDQYILNNMEVSKEVDLLETIDQPVKSDAVCYENIEPEFENGLVSCKYSKVDSLENNDTHSSVIIAKENVEKVMNASLIKQSISITSTSLSSKLTSMDNTKGLNNLSSEEGLGDRNLQVITDTNATFDKDIGQEDCFKEIVNLNLECSDHAWEKDKNIINIEQPVVICNDNHDPNEIILNANTNVDLVPCGEAYINKMNSECLKDSENNDKPNIIVNTMSVIEVITQTKSKEDEEEILKMGNVLNLPDEISEESKKISLPDILDTINKSQLPQKQTSEDNNLLYEKHSETELQGINVNENLDIDVMQKQIHVDNVSLLPKTPSTLFEITDNEVRQGSELTKTLEKKISVIDNNIDHEHTNEELKNINIDTTMKTITSPPLSPKIFSKGYNLNFEEIDDPFASNSKIRVSPPPECTSTEKYKNTNKNLKTDLQRRKSQPECNNQEISIKNKINSTFSGAVDISKIRNGNENLDSKESSVVVSNDNCHDRTDVVAFNSPNLKKDSTDVPVYETEKTVNTEGFINTENNKISEFDELKTNYIYSDQISCIKNNQCELPVERYAPKNVFNLPEMTSNMDFNPFITKSRVCRSPSPTLEVKDTFNQFKVPVYNQPCLVNSTYNSDDKITVDLDGKQTIDKNGQDCSIASSSKSADDATVQEVNTEDEDTIEGPFFETDDLNNVEKMSNCSAEHDDMIHFSDLPKPQVNDDNPDNAEMFIDAEAFEFLLSQNKSNVVLDSGKESLFLKFDPLFAKRMSSDGVLAALSKVQKRQSTPKRISKAPTIDVTYCEKLSPEPSNFNVTTDVNNMPETSYEDPNVAFSKPMMVVNPAVNSIVTPRNKTTTTPKTNRRSLTFTSPAIAVIDRLLSLSGNNSTLNHETLVTQVERNETDMALTQLRELLAEKEIHVHNLRLESKELRERLSILESQVRSLETESEQKLRKVNDLNECLVEKTKINKSMAAVVEEYERTIASLVDEKEQDKKRHMEERMRLINERDEQTAHLASMEISFNDLHSKYEKCKQVILSYKSNEDAYRISIKEFEETVAKMQNNYELLKQHATTKLNQANQELEKYNKAHEAELLKLNAMIKRKELHITSLEESLAQKTKANEELTAICDELINKVY